MKFPDFFPYNDHATMDRSNLSSDKAALRDPYYARMHVLRPYRFCHCANRSDVFTTGDQYSDFFARCNYDFLVNIAEYFLQNCRRICSKIAEKLAPKSLNFFKIAIELAPESPKCFLQNRWKTYSITAENLLEVAKELLQNGGKLTTIKPIVTLKS